MGTAEGLGTTLYIILKNARFWWDSNPQPLNGFFHCSLEVQCAIHCATEPGSGCFFYAPTATRTYLFPVSHRRPLRPLFTSSRGPTSVTTFDSSVGRAEDCS